MSLIIETDIGSDPDDFFALCYLLSTGIEIKLIIVYPGYNSQISLVNFILNYTNRKILVASSKEKNKAGVLNGFHLRLNNLYRFTPYVSPDGAGKDFISEIINNTRNCDLIIIGPPKGAGDFARLHPEYKFGNITIQGGFIGYDVHNIQCKRLKKFDGVITYPTYNLNGCISGTEALMNADCVSRRFVSKNVNHTVIYNDRINDWFKELKPENKAMELFLESAQLLDLNKGKKFHDPVASVCHIHPEIAAWVKAKLYYGKSDKGYEWGSALDEKGDDIIVNIDYLKFWELLRSGK
jgi:hypothetical protein